MSLPDTKLSLEQKVAQLFMLGYEDLTPNPITERFLALGLGGLIFFRDNFDALEQTPQAVVTLLESLNAAVPSHLPRPLMGIDQEGGQVERLPHTQCPTALTPRAVALAPDSETLANRMYRELAQNLVSLGFNLNFFPTLDVNLQPSNPIIGVRSFGDDPQTVWRFGKIALEAFESASLISVGKHFPGHGNGTVDSHLDLPTLTFTEAELMPFQAAIDAGVPAMLVAHGYYPALQTTPEEQALPSSASPAIIQGLLRERCGFQGVVITDDMCMGAITKHKSPIEAALAALKAGVDILLYKQSTEAEWAVFEAVVQAFRNGDLPKSQLDASLQRIVRLKAKYILPISRKTPLVSPEQCAQQAEAIAQQGICALSGQKRHLPLQPRQSILLVHPDRTRMGNYAYDVPTSPTLEQLLQDAGFALCQSLSYPPRESFETTPLINAVSAQPETIIFISFNPLIYSSQAQLYNDLRQRFPKTPIILASAGTPYDTQVLPDPALHLSLCNYRPATMRAFTSLLQAGFATEAAPFPVAPAKPL